MKTATFKLLSNTISVQIQKSHLHNYPDYVKTNKFRPKEFNMDTDSLTLESEFIKDIQYQIDFINQKNIWNANNSLLAFNEACKKHINEYGRLIITDLYTYTDCSLHIISAIEKNTPMKDFNEIYENYVNQIIKFYRNYIYEMKPWGLVKI